MLTKIVFGPTDSACVVSLTSASRLIQPLQLLTDAFSMSADHKTKFKTLLRNALADPMTP